MLCSTTTITTPMISGPTAEAKLNRGRDASPGCSGALSGVAGAARGCAAGG